MWWTLFTIVLVVALTHLAVLAINKKISVRWWEWVLFGAGVLLLVFTLQNFVGAQLEGESKPAWMFLWTLGIPALILIATPAVLVFMRGKSN